ncbi:T9SS type A sorting domain-containing protein [Hymenobacter sp. IS2118]|uniref:T9SS type A sorting domain-containing protein n=1 Tax=Hymenobacter sp. IS2118 TaxID=1505605 RepID=UPI00055673B9|nr:T9SS type A sorting domain-containing protein [Hymenobacter sp. IS2118]
MNNYFSRFLLTVLLGLGLQGAARATTPPTGRSLAEALNPDGTLKAGANGSFDARQFWMDTAPDGRPVFRPAGTTGAGDERWQNGFGLPNGTDSEVQVVVRAGTNIYIGGAFTVVGTISANRVAKWDGTAWSALGTGIVSNGVFDTYVRALAVASNGDLFVGGQFSQAGGVAANHVARWNGTAWSSLGTGAANGVSAGSGYVVNALAVAGNGDVYAGGSFVQAGGVAAANMARWNGTTWNALGTGIPNGSSSYVLALAVAASGEVYAGGQFTQAGGISADNVAKWNGLTWSSLSFAGANGTNSAVNALAVAANGDLYAGGRFVAAGGVLANRIARWNGTVWSSLGTGAANGLNVDVVALAVTSTGDVYAGGGFTQAGGMAANQIARWNGTTWSSIGAGLAGGYAAALAIDAAGGVYVGGSFTQAGGVGANRVAHWNGSAWTPWAPGSGKANGVNGPVYALAVAANGDVYAGGTFTQAGGTPANNVARWNGTAWVTLGPGISNGIYPSSVTALAVAANGDVYVGGSFGQAGSTLANNVARWSNGAWSSLGTGLANGVNSYVESLAISGSGDVYVGGVFTQAGGASANRVARWSGTGWSSLGTGLDSYVNVLALAANGDLYVGGEFTQAGGIVAHYVACWNGTNWSALGTGTGVTNGVGYSVFSLAVVANGDLYVGGTFSQAGGIPANGVARWNGTTWSSLGTGAANGVGDTIFGIVVTGTGEVYVGGPHFSQAGGVPASRVAKWNGTAWSSLGTGTNDVVWALAPGPNGQLYVGGTFTTTGDGSKHLAHFGIYDPNAPLATTPSARATPAALFPNPAHGTATLRLPAGAPHLPLTLTDALGRVVRRYLAPVGSEAALDLRGLPAGMYVVGCGQVTQRLMVE